MDQPHSLQKRKYARAHLLFLCSPDSAPSTQASPSFSRGSRASKCQQAVPPPHMCSQTPQTTGASASFKCGPTVLGSGVRRKSSQNPFSLSPASCHPTAPLPETCCCAAASIASHEGLSCQFFLSMCQKQRQERLRNPPTCIPPPPVFMLVCIFYFE